MVVCTAGAFLRRPGGVLGMRLGGGGLVGSDRVAAGAELAGLAFPGKVSTGGSNRMALAVWAGQAARAAAVADMRTPRECPDGGPRGAVRAGPEVDPACGRHYPANYFTCQ